MDRYGVSVLKKIVIFLLMICSLYADSISDIKAKIIENIAKTFTHKKVIKIYNQDPYFNDIFNANPNFKRVYTYRDADIILTKDSSMFKNLPGNDKLPFIISTKYKDYKNNKDIDIGAFFWQKGRPNLILNAKIIQENYIKIPKEYNKFLE